MVTGKNSISAPNFKRLKSILMCLVSSIFGVILITNSLQAQPAKGANKFLGNITTSGAVRSDFGEYWNQITGENETKWANVEGSRDKMNWKGTDSIAKYAKENGIPWKFHCLLWGSQYPSWINNLSESEQLEEIEEWMDEAAERYPDVSMIDVVNEAYPSHKPPPFKNALGGDGSTGFDWIIKAFEMARERWPNAILIYNDFNTIEWDSEVRWMVKLANALKEADAPMDAIGVQAHDVCNVSTSKVEDNIDKLAATGYPIIVSEYDIGRSSDDQQKKIMEEQFTMFWNHPKVVGITYWGYISGRTWRNGTGLKSSSGSERPALTWLIDYVKENPDPPNDYPGLIPGLQVGVASPNKFFITTTNRSFANSDHNRIDVFDLQGRMTGARFINNRLNLHQSTTSSPGTYVVRVDGQCKGTYHKIR